MTKRVAFLGLSVALAAWTLSVQAADAMETNEAQVQLKNCVTEIAPVGEGEKVSATKHIGCFPTLAAAIAAATDGVVALPADTTPESLSESDLSAAATRLIGIDYDRRYYGGTTSVWYARNSYGCFGGFSYVANIPAYFNNRLTSTRGFGGCNRNTSYDGYFQRGDWVRCFPNCYYVGGFMDNRASSKRWQR
jgi:hypothetical protein